MNVFVTVQKLVVYRELKKLKSLREHSRPWAEKRFQLISPLLLSHIWYLYFAVFC